MKLRLGLVLVVVSMVNLSATVVEDSVFVNLAKINEHLDRAIIVFNEEQEFFQGMLEKLDNLKGTVAEGRDRHRKSMKCILSTKAKREESVQQCSALVQRKKDQIAKLKGKIAVLNQNVEISSLEILSLQNELVVIKAEYDELSATHIGEAAELKVRLDSVQEKHDEMIAVRVRFQEKVNELTAAVEAYNVGINADYANEQKALGY